jgi:hypothetical protein
MGCMAGFSFYLSHFFGMDTLIVDRNKSKQQKKILWSHLYHDVYMECGNNMVDMERISAGSSSRFYGQ